MDVTSTLEDLTAGQARRMLSGLPEAEGYRVIVKPLKYRDTPHLAAMTDFSTATITLQVPVPFYPFGEIVPYGAKRRPGRSIRFIWLTEGVTFRKPREVLRFLYLHEWMHWYLHVQHGRGTSAETTCDRFALLNYRKREVTIADATAAMRRSRGVPTEPVGRVAAKAPAAPTFFER
jgi:hypothetical protein